MRIYELMFIADPRVDEEGRAALVEKVQKVIVEKAAGTIEKVDRWGIRKLAYKLPRTKLTEGDYTVVLFRSNGEKLQEIDVLFQVTPELIRKQIVRREDLEKKERKEWLKTRDNPVEEMSVSDGSSSGMKEETIEPVFEVEGESQA
ncbi:MAG TPA: 30S ribosomal protein S6 [Thermotogota bacterium]|nr:30S ribosomal protein S6 [Thermotogota bacterium]HPY47499.1 30S ribosomal protein S6 [Thermotogota bacterium]